jgi:hypothetical protein
VCEFGQFCTNAGYCQAGCRDTASCNDPNLLCVDGTCQDRNSVGSCATKADCMATKVCTDNQCVDPPAMCTGPQDCPGTGQCNGFTRTCFDPNGECMMAADCAGKPQCTSGCTCSSDRRCVAAPVCDLATERQTCGLNNYCDTTSNPPRCASSPICSRQADCDATRLACNRTTRVCERGAACTTNATCAAPFGHCNTTAGYCQEATCTNMGITCMATETCRMDGTCGPGNAVTCTRNEDCPTMPSMQYCEPTNATCRAGCRNDSNCNAGIGEKCNGNHVCAIPMGSSSSGGMGGGGNGDACADDSECRAGFGCSAINVCRELCTPGCPPCPLTGFGCFFGIYCTELGTPPTMGADGGFICQ